jgi:ParB family chromosome partitioning protein
MSQFYNDAIFWIEVDKIKPNPYQPRRDFDEAQLRSLADSIRQYGVLQALVVTRKEVEKPEGGIGVEYELVAGERRLRAARLAGLLQVPALIRTGEETDLMKLELAIIENIQREDLSPVDRARAFERLAKEFSFTHSEIGKKVGKSREYVSNTLRILMLPEAMLAALSEGKITEGHTRPLMMLVDRPEEQETLFKEIIFKKLNVRTAENIARNIAVERARKLLDHELIDIEGLFKEKLGTRVHIEKRDEGGRVLIDFFNKDDLRHLLERIAAEEEKAIENASPLTDEEKVLMEDDPHSAKASRGEDDESLYSVANFSI